MRSVFNFVLVFFMVVIIITAGGCRYDKQEFIACTDIPDNLKKFNASVSHIIQNNCAKSPDCHARGGLSGVEFTDYTQIRAKVNQIMLRVVVQQTMPAAGPLPPLEIAKIRCWIDDGAPNN